MSVICCLYCLVSVNTLQAVVSGEMHFAVWKNCRSMFILFMLLGASLFGRGGGGWVFVCNFVVALKGACLFVNIFYIMQWTQVYIVWLLLVLFLSFLLTHKETSDRYSHTWRKPQWKTVQCSCNCFIVYWLYKLFYPHFLIGKGTRCAQLHLESSIMC